MQTKKQKNLIKEPKRLELYNPFWHLSKAIGFLFWPLTLIPWIKRDILPIVKLINSGFVNSRIAPFIAFFYPLILVSVLGRVGSPHFIIIGIVSIVPLIVGLQTLPPLIITLRNSSILKRIGATNTKTSDVTFTLIFYFSVISIISSTFNAGMGFLIYSKNIHFEIFNWGQYVLTTLIGTIIAISFGILVSSYLRKEQTALLIGLLLTLPGAFLSAQFIPPSIVNKWSVIRYVAFLFPQKIVVVLSFAASNNHSIFDISNVVTTDFNATKEASQIVQDLKINGIVPVSQAPVFDNWLLSLRNKFEIVDKTEMTIAWILAPIEILTFSVVSCFTFKWGIR